MLLLVVFSACDKLTEPPYVVPTYELKASDKLISIADLKAKHTLGGVPNAIDENLVVRGVIVGDDESGNIYKSLYIQDETGGINISINQVNLYNIMPVGQEVFIEMKGLFVGDYNKGYQIGDTTTHPRYGLQIARYEWNNEIYRDESGNYSRRHFFPNGVPDLKNVPAPRVINSANEITSDMYCTLVTLKNITLDGAEDLTPWATKEATVNRTAKFADGSSLIIRTSGYCNFYADYMPTGRGDITGILSVFGFTNQFYIRSRADIGTFIEE